MAQITSRTIADDAIIESKILNNAIINSKFANNTIDSAKYILDSIDGQNLSANGKQGALENKFFNAPCFPLALRFCPSILSKC